VKIKGIEFMLLGVGALAGAFLRYKIASSPVFIGLLPINIMIVNVIGSLALGVFSVISVAWNLDAKYSLLFAVGFCGSFTTMSSFALESNNLLENKQFSIFAVNILANIGLSLGAIILGRSLASFAVWR
jgi:fluoride exporter